jgi:hypothetical protein
MQRFPLNYLYAAQDNETVGVVGLGKKYNFSSDHKDMKAPQFVQLYGLQEMYINHPDKMWYYMAGDDAYTDVDLFLDWLGKYDADESCFLGGLLAPERRPAFIKTDRFPEYMDSIDGKAGKFKWFYGSRPYVLSNKAMKIFSENVDEWMAENEIHKWHYMRDPKYDGIPGMGYFPDKFTGMILSMTGGVEFKSEMTHAVATSAEMFEGRKGSQKGEKYWGYHYVDPGALIVA